MCNREKRSYKKAIIPVCEKTKPQLKHVYSKFFSSFCFQTFEYQ